MVPQHSPHNINRREFLKLTSTATVSLPFQRDSTAKKAGADAKNVIVLVFDAWSAKNISLYSYPRLTTPNLLRLGQRATVYHNHFAGGHETYPGTAALLTGCHNWTTYNWGLDYYIPPPFDRINLFGLFENYYRIAYTHNPFAEQVINYFRQYIDHYQPRQSLYLNSDYWVSKYFEEDLDIASLSWVRIGDLTDDRYTNSLFMWRLIEEQQDLIVRSYRDQFPLGTPVVQGTNYFILEDAINWIETMVLESPRPFLGYFHLLPPHDKYKPRSQDFDSFKDDGLSFNLKEKHPLANRKNGENLNLKRKIYDEYILYVDDELGRLFDYLDHNGIMDDTWFVLTSDHGESFERGIECHQQDTFHQPIVRIPLLIFEPGHKKRRDVYQTTAAIDLLPTLLKVNGFPIPAEVEGRLLPPYDDGETPSNRTFFAGSWAKTKSVDWKLCTALMMINGQHKLMRYQGYETLPGNKLYYELYNLDEDPEELDNLYGSSTALAKRLSDELDEVMEHSIKKFLD